MPRIVDDSMVETVTQVLLGAIDAGDGGTDEQRAVLRALVEGYWERPDLDLGALAALSPDEAADAVANPSHRRRVRELMALLESCRHPLTEAQVDRVEAYAKALHEDGPDIAIVRSLVNNGAQHAMADFQRFIDEIQVDLAEPTLTADYLQQFDTPKPELAARLRQLHELPEGTLGYEYIEFYRRNNLTLPGDDPNLPAVFVSHDMCHVIAGYEPTGPEEIALGAMQLGVVDSDAHWVQFLGNLAIHEAGYFNNESFVGKTATLEREGAAALLAEGLRRGAQCTGDFTHADHLGIAAIPLAEVRERYGVPPRP
jgi:ubiquinone biosynthesis protein Coq4